MQKEFERRIQLISPDLIIDAKPSSDLIFSILNEAQKRYVMQNYVGDDQMVAETNTHTKNTDSIKSLLVEKKITASSTTENGNARFLLPTGSKEKYFLYVHSISTVTKTYKQENDLTDAVNVNNQLVKYRDLPKFMETAYNRPIVRTTAVALVSDTSNQLYLEVVVDHYTTLKSIILTYYREPVEFNTISNTNQCELPESVHDEIVNLAVNMFITEGKYRLQAKQPEQKEQ
jgi:hypothetical protein